MMKLEELDNISLQNHVLKSFPPPSVASGEYNKWIEDMIFHGTSPKTVYNYGQTVSGFLKFAKKPVSSISESDIKSYARHLLTEGKSPYTIQMYLVRVGIFLKHNNIDINVYKYAPSKSTDIPEYLTREEVDSFINAIDKDVIDDDEEDAKVAILRYKSLFTLLADTGVRATEACDLMKKDINFKERLLIVRKGKRKKTRMVPVSTSTLDLLTKYWESRTDKNPKAFEYKGGDLNRMVMWRLTKKIAKKAGLDHATSTHKESIHPHMFRHTFATLELKRLIHEGNGRMDAVLIIKEALGHSDIKTTLIYLTLVGEDIRDMMGR